MIPMDNFDPRVLLASMRSLCSCNDPDTEPPTDWVSHARIPHHCDCVLYPFERPDPKVAPTAHADAVASYERLVAEQNDGDDGAGTLEP